MTRLDSPIDWEDLHRQAGAAKRHVSYWRVRCQHGKTRDQTCVSCEGGYVTDTHPFALLPARVVAYAVSDDLTEVACFTKRREP